MVFRNFQVIRKEPILSDWQSLSGHYWEALSAWESHDVEHGAVHLLGYCHRRKENQLIT